MATKEELVTMLLEGDTIVSWDNDVSALYTLTGLIVKVRHPVSIDIINERDYILFDNIEEVLPDWKLSKSSEVFFINRFVVPKPYTVEELLEGYDNRTISLVYMTGFADEIISIAILMQGKEWCKRVASLGIAHKTEEGAKAHRDALLSFTDFS